MLNKVILMGRLTRDPELRRTGNGTAVAGFSVAVERNYITGEERATDFIDCVAWRSTAEFICKYFTKGSMIVVDGSIQTRKWTDKDGNNRRSVEVLAESCYFGESKQAASARQIAGSDPVDPAPDFTVPENTEPLPF